MIQKAPIVGKISNERTANEAINQKNMKPTTPPKNVPLSLTTIFRVRAYDEYDDGFKDEYLDEFYEDFSKAKESFDRYVDAWFNSTEHVHVSPDDWNIVDTVCFSSVCPREMKLSVFCGSEEDSISYYIELSAITLN